MHGCQEYNADPCGKYTKQVFMAMNRQIQMRLYAKSCHSHEQGPVKLVSKINLKIFVYHGV
jgi:hypothetical protein